MESEQSKIKTLESRVAGLAAKATRQSVRNSNILNRRQAIVICKPAADIAKGGTGTCRVYTALEEDTGIDIEAIALGAEVKEDKWCVAQVDLSRRWYVGPWECP